MKLIFGKTGAIVSLAVSLSIIGSLSLYIRSAMDSFTFFPNGLLSLVLVGLGFFFFRTGMLNYFVLSFNKDQTLVITRPYYKIPLFENAIQKHTVDLKEISKVMIVIPERTYLPANYLFFNKENLIVAKVHLTFDEKEGEGVKAKLRQHKVKCKEVNVLDVNYDSMKGVTTLY